MGGPKWRGSVVVWKHGAMTSQRKRSRVCSEGAGKGYTVVAATLTTTTFQKLG